MCFHESSPSLIAEGTHRYVADRHGWTPTVPATIRTRHRNIVVGHPLPKHTSAATINRSLQRGCKKLGNGERGDGERKDSGQE
jgi:hypothetical protein